MLRDYLTHAYVQNAFSVNRGSTRAWRVHGIQGSLLPREAVTRGANISASLPCIHVELPFNGQINNADTFAADEIASSHGGARHTHWSEMLNILPERLTRA